MVDEKTTEAAEVVKDTEGLFGKAGKFLFGDQQKTAAAKADAKAAKLEAEAEMDAFTDTTKGAIDDAIFQAFGITGHKAVEEAAASGQGYGHTYEGQQNGFVSEDTPLF